MEVSIHDGRIGAHIDVIADDDPFGGDDAPACHGKVLANLKYRACLPRAQNDRMVSINAVLQVDLLGQCNAESLFGRQFSGTGGQLDWIRGAHASPGGKAFTCLYSTYTNRNGQLKSNIVSTLELGDMVTVPATDVSYVVTEFGAVNLAGTTTWQRAKLLISIAHPDFRAELEEAAQRINVLTKGARGLPVAG